MTLTRFHKPMTKQDQVEVSVREIEAIPAGANPFHHDAWRMGADLTESYLAMFNSGEKPTKHMVMCNRETGQRFMFEFTPKTPTLLDIVKFEPTLDKILGEEHFLFERSYFLETERAEYRSVDGGNYTDAEDVYDLWFRYKGYMILTRLLINKEAFIKAWHEFTFADDLTEEEIEGIYNSILDATPNAKYTPDYGPNDPPKGPWKYFHVSPVVHDGSI